MKNIRNKTGVILLALIMVMSQAFLPGIGTKVSADTDPNLYNMEIKAVDEYGSPIEDIKINMNWSVDVYSSYPQEAVSPGVYQLQKQKENGDWIYYTFTVSKDGYKSHEGSKFCFRSDWYNPYFDVKADNHNIAASPAGTTSVLTLETAVLSGQWKMQTDFTGTEHMQLIHM